MPVMSTPNYSEASGSRPSSAFTDTMIAQSEATPNARAQSDNNTEDETTENGENPRKDNKNKSAPRYDIMWACIFCADKLRESTDAKKHVNKMHKGLMFDDVMIRGPDKYRNS